MAKSKGQKKGSKGTSLIKEISPNKNITKEGIYESVDHPLFSFKYLQDNSISRCRDSRFFFNFLMRLKKLSELGWDEIRTSSRHGFGMEKIPRSNIIPQLQYPTFITPEVKEFSVFRSSGSNTGLVGFQMGKIFYIFYIEASHGDIYSHN